MVRKANWIYDGSHLPFEENIVKTKAVVVYAHAHGVLVEGELGTIGGIRVKEENYSELINNGTRKFNVGTELLINWTREVKDNLRETEVNKSLQHNIILENTAF
ncbi:fructose-1,6-bisphosphate aldolase [Enterococcus sp. 665A]|uniref:Fructose-1,6-bisphosphate aldolase n=1 Tax=Candidatus Enterococcus ferrettii TaxID=2815324 RepID=A0ABV0ESE0_9ENTE|nr:class II fructose-bisphosphate aldolase [Enterococcus sp. 665A]